MTFSQTSSISVSGCRKRSFSSASTPAKKLGADAKSRPRQKSQSLKRSLLKSSSKGVAHGIRAKLPRHKQLRALRVKDVTLVRYQQAVDTFRVYCQKHSMRSKKMHNVDRYLGSFFADLCEQGEPYNKASYTLFGYIMLVSDESVPENTFSPLLARLLKDGLQSFLSVPEPALIPVSGSYLPK